MTQSLSPHKGFRFSVREIYTVYNEKQIRHECVGAIPTYLVQKE